MVRVPTTTAGLGQPVKNRLSYQDPNYQYQIGGAALSTATMAYLQASGVKDANGFDPAHQYSGAYGISSGKRPHNSAQSCDSEQKAVEIRKKLSQLSSANEESKSSKNGG